MRVTRKSLESLVEEIRERLGRPKEAWVGKNADRKSQVGHLFLHYAACYGGYQLTEITGINGGERELHSDRKSPKEMYAFLRGALVGLDLRK